MIIKLLSTINTTLDLHFTSLNIISIMNYFLYFGGRVFATPNPEIFPINSQ